MRGEIIIVHFNMTTIYFFPLVFLLLLIFIKFRIILCAKKTYVRMSYATKVCQTTDTGARPLLSNNNKNKSIFISIYNDKNNNTFLLFSSLA